MNEWLTLSWQVDILCEAFKRQHAAGGACDFYHAFKCYALDAITSIAFAKPMNATLAPDFKSPMILAMDATIPTLVSFIQIPTLRKIFSRIPPSLLPTLNKTLKGYVDIRQVSTVLVLTKHLLTDVWLYSLWHNKSRKFWQILPSLRWPLILSSTTLCSIIIPTNLLTTKPQLPHSHLKISMKKRSFWCSLVPTRQVTLSPTVLHIASRTGTSTKPLKTSCARLGLNWMRNRNTKCSKSYLTWCAVALLS